MFVDYIEHIGMGDKTVEINSLKMLERSFPKLDNLGKLAVNYTDNNEYNLNCYDINDYPHTTWSPQLHPLPPLNMLSL